MSQRRPPLRSTPSKSHDIPLTARVAELLADCLPVGDGPLEHLQRAQVVPDEGGEGRQREGIGAVRHHVQQPEEGHRQTENSQQPTRTASSQRMEPISSRQEQSAAKAWSRPAADKSSQQPLHSERG